MAVSSKYVNSIIACKDRRELQKLLWELNKCEVKDNRDIDFLLALAEISHQLDNNENAIRYITKALSMESTNNEYYARLYFFSALSELDKAHYYEAMLVDDESSPGYLAASMLLYKSNRFVECKECLKKVERDLLYRFDYNYLILLCMDALGEDEESIQKVWNENNILKESETGKAFYIQHLFKMGQNRECVNLCKKIIQRAPNSILATKAIELLKRIQKSNDSINDALHELDDLIGMNEVKERIKTLYRAIKYEKMRQEKLGIEAFIPIGHYVFIGNPGTGKTTVARILCDIFYQLGMIENNKLIETDRSGLVGQFVGETTQKTKAILEKAKGGMLFIDEAYALYRRKDSNDYGQEAIDVLMKGAEDNRNNTIILLAGYEQEMKELMKANPGLESRFRNYIYFPDYSNEELLLIAKSIAEKRQYRFSKDAERAFLYLIEKKRVDERFGNARTVRNIMEEVFIRKGNVEYAEELSLEDLTTISAQDLGCEEETKEQINDYLKELDDMIGLTEVKEEIHVYLKKLEYYQQDFRENGAPIPVLFNHMAFIGNPGTGKTTVARLLGNILREIGVLKKGQLIEVSRADLVSQWSGHTAIQTKEKCEEAYGGILFIDEAHALIHDSQDHFGQEAIDMLIKEMEDNRGKLLVILAGYDDKMESLFESNPGLASRISKKIVFPDYDEGELLQIFQYYLAKDGFCFQQEEDVVEWLHKKYQIRNINFGNARDVRKWYEEAKTNMICRVIDQKLEGSERKIMKTEDLYGKETK